MKQRTRKLLTLLLIAAMVMSLMVPALAADTAQSETPYTYDAGDYTFGKISHPNSAPGQPDGLVDYTGNGTVAVTGTADGADGQGDRGQSYAWAAMAYGDYVYVGTCYAAMGQTLTAMDTVMGHKFDEETMRAELNAIFNGTFFYGQEDGGNSGGVLVKVNVHTGEMTLLMSKSLNGIAPLFRNAIRYKDKLYFCGSVNANGRGGLPSIYEVDPSNDSITCVYQGLSNMQEYAQAYKAGVCTGIRGMAVYDGKLVISNVGVDGGYLLISDNPSKGFTKIATQSDLFNYPAVHYKDSVYGGGIWEIVEYNGSLYVAMCTGTPATRVGDNMRSFAIVRGTCSGDWNDPDAWTWTPVVGDQADGAKYTFGIDPARTRAAACNMCIYDGYLYIGEYNDEEIPLEELMFSQDFGFLARNLEQSVNLYRMSIGADGTEQMELVVGEPTEMFPAGGILCKRSGFGDYENQYFWQSKVFDGKLFLGTFDTSSLLEPLGQFTNGDLLHMSRDEWASQIGYLKVLLQLLLNKNTGDGTLLAADADTDAAIDAAVDAVNEEADSPETFSLTDAQYDTLRQGIDDGAYAAAYSVSTLGSLRRLNSLLAKLTDLVETNDIAGFVDIYQQACDLYSGISDKLPEALKKLYDALVRITELPLPDDVAWVEPRLCENCTALQNIVLPAAMTEVPRGLLRGCTGLRRVTLQGAVTAVGNGAFAGCDALADVYFTGTRAQWDAVDVGANNARLTAAAVHLSAPAHTYPEAWTVVRAPTCTDDGLRTRTCLDPGCGKTLSETIPALGHDWDDGVIVRAPSGVRMGERRVTCRRCGRTQAEAIPPEIAAYEQFHDIDRNAWSYDGIQYCVARGLMSGTDTHTFLPGGVTTRAQLVQVLYHLAGDPDMTGVTTPFTDLTSDWYQAAVAWAYKTGVVDGTSPTTFSPGLPVTREQAAVLLMRYAARLPGFAGSDAPADLSAFADGGSVSGWARAGMADAVALGLFGGTQDTGGRVWLRPGESATRAEIAAVLARFGRNVAHLL